MSQVRLFGSVVAAALAGAAVALASPGCEQSAEQPEREDAASEEPTDEAPPEPAPDEDEGDDEQELGWSRRTAPGPYDRPRCHDNGWHDSGHCLTKCAGDGAYAVASERRAIDYKWCFARAWQYCDARGGKLHDACWGVAGDRRENDESSYED